MTTTNPPTPPTLDALHKEDSEYDDEPIVYYYMHQITVDGVTTIRDDAALENPTFFSMKSDFVPAYQYTPGDTDHMDMPVIVQHDCHRCRTPWQMNDARYLRSGDIACAHCGAYGDLS